MLQQIIGGHVVHKKWAQERIRAAQCQNMLLILTQLGFWNFAFRFARFWAGARKYIWSDLPPTLILDCASSSDLVANWRTSREHSEYTQRTSSYVVRHHLGQEQRSSWTKQNCCWSLSLWRKSSNTILPVESSSRRFQVLPCFVRVPVKVSCCLPLPQLGGKRNSSSSICYKIILICCRHVCSKKSYLSLKHILSIIPHYDYIHIMYYGSYDMFQS